MKPAGPVARREDYVVSVIPSRDAAALVRAYHYAQSTSHRAWSFAAMRKSDGQIRAVAQFLPPLPPAARYVATAGLKRGYIVQPSEVFALTRLVVVPGEPQNVASMLVGAALRQIRKDGRWTAVVTYADTSEGHTGQVYRALNATYLGLTRKEPYGVDKKGMRVSRKSTTSRTSQEMRALGLTQQMSEGKHRFVWWLGPKSRAGASS